MAIELVKNKKHLIVKRDGRIEPYQEEKMRKVLRWAIEKAINEGHYKWDKQFINDKIIDQMIDEVLENVSVKIYDKISISKLFDAVIETCESFISRLQPVWDDVTKNLLVQKYYKETWGIKRDEYPDYLEVIKKGASAGIDIYKKIKDEFTEEEIKQLGSFIKPEKDFYFTSLGIKSFMTRYALKYSKTKQLELPQHTFLRLAIKSFMYDDKEKRFEFIKQRYEDLSDSIYTEATPRYNDNDMEASCVLMKMGDDSWSITRTLQAVGLYSKHGGGTAVDVCDIRCRGSLVGVSGESDGVIPFIRMLETDIMAFKQGCYSEDTQILTEKGWKYFYELNGEKVAQYVYDKKIMEGKIEFVSYTDYIEYEYRGDMYHFSHNSDLVDLLVTPNHRMVKIIKPSGNLIIDRADNLNYCKDNYLPVAGFTGNKNKNLNTFDKFLIAFQADGYIHKRVNGSVTGYYAYGFRLKKERKIKRLKELLDKLISEKYDVKYKIHKRENDVYEFYINFSVKYGLLPKDFSWVDISKYSEKEINDFIYELYQWDGNEAKKIYYTKNKINVDKVQALAVQAGYRTKININSKNIYTISFLKRTTVAGVEISSVEKRNRGIKKSTETYQGKVYCVTVPSSILVVRRNNKIAICGNSTRRGACAVYFNWWHYEVEDLIMLKDEGGNEWKRARSLQYGIKLNRLFLDRIINNEEITLFDPKETPELLSTFGNEFEKWYIHYEQKGGIRKKKIKARDLAYLLAKVRLETGNLYIFFDDNVNENKPFEDYISQSNLCSEIVLPTKPSYLKNANVKQDLSSGELILVEKVEPGRIALCNLSSINVAEWDNLSNERKRKIAYTLLRSHDNLIDLGFYPVKEGEISNKLTRPIGIGITNLAYYFAKNKTKFTDDKVLKLQFDIIEDVAYYFIEASIELAKERGAFPEFRNSKWSNGWLPIDYNKELFDKYADVWQHHRWADLRNAIMSYGIRFSTHFAIAPTATSALSIKGGSTESINPPKNLFQQKTGTINGVQLAPQFNKYGKWYQTAYEVPNERLIELAAIRQLFLDQAQSVDTFYANPDSAFDVIKDIIFAEKQGLKTLYYANSLKAVEKEVCESCSS